MKVKMKIDEVVLARQQLQVTGFNLEGLMIACRGNFTLAGEVVGVHRGTIYRWVKSKRVVYFFVVDGELRSFPQHVPINSNQHKGIKCAA